MIDQAIIGPVLAILAVPAVERRGNTLLSVYVGFVVIVLFGNDNG
jgi:hypothetical protein